MRFSYFEELMIFTAGNCAKAQEFGNCLGHNVDFWHGAYMTAIMCALEFFPKETNKHMKTVCDALRASGEDEAADSLENYVNAKAKRRA